MFTIVKSRKRDGEEGWGRGMGKRDGEEGWGRGMGEGGTLVL
jgi:hypothetical protein